MYEAHREISFTNISYFANQSLPPPISNPPHFHSLSSDTSFSHPHAPPQPALPLDPSPNSGPQHPNYSAFDDRPNYYQDPNPASSSWVVKHAPPVRYSPVRAVQPLIQATEASPDYVTSFAWRWGGQSSIANVRKSKLKRPNSIMKKKCAHQSVKCQLCKIECTSIELYEKHLSGKKHTNKLQKKYAPKITFQAVKVSQLTNKSGNTGETGKPGAKGTGVTNDLETKKQKLLEGGTAVQSLRVCAICNVACNGEIAFADHMAGKKHLAQERALVNTANPNPTSAIKAKRKSDDTKDKKTNNAGSAWCEVCKISCTSDEGLIVHKQGKKHKKNVEKLQNPNPDPTTPALTATPAKSKEPEDVEMKKRKVLECGAAADAIRTCTICDVVCNSKTVFNAHLAGQKHAAMVKQKQAEEAGAEADDGQQREAPAS